MRSGDLISASGHPEQNPFYLYFKSRLPELLDKTCSTPFVGFSLNYLSQALCTFAMIGYIRKEFPGRKIVLGGGLVTSWMKGPAWKNPFGGLVDHLIAGPGEGPLLGLLGAGEKMRMTVRRTTHHFPFTIISRRDPFSRTADRADATGINAPSVRKLRKAIPTFLFPLSGR